jgi:hypothetical protein
MSESTFTAGERATLDLRDSAGDVTIKDWDGATVKIASAAEQPPFVLKEQDTFRIRLDSGGTISLPLGLPAEVVAPAAVRVKVMRAGGETQVRTAESSRSSNGAQAGESKGPREVPVDFAAFADVLSEQGRRVFAEVTRAVRSSGTGMSEEVARKMEEAADRVEAQARHFAERMQREADRAMRAVGHADEHTRRHAERARRRAEHEAERARHHAERVARRARGRWWFTERADEWATTSAGARTAARPGPSGAERLAVLQMLQEGKISSEQAARLLDALGG